MTIADIQQHLIDEHTRLTKELEKGNWSRLAEEIIEAVMEANVELSNWIDRQRIKEENLNQRTQDTIDTLWPEGKLKT